MGKIESLLTSEIVRLVRREVRREIEPLRKDIQSLSRGMKLMTAAPLSPRASHGKPTVGIDLTASRAEADRARISSGLIRKLRAKLGLTQAQLASLVGVSAAAVQSWEQDIARPGGTNRAALIALRKAGKREVVRLLADKGVAERRRRPRTQLQASRKRRSRGGEGEGQQQG